MSTPDDHDDQHAYEHLVEPATKPAPGAPPEHGAQWDEVHGRWERWDAGAGAWVVIGDAGDGVDPADEEVLAPHLARELLHAQELEADDRVREPDVARAPEPPEHVPGAQWNEIESRWERWDEAAGAWVAAETAVAAPSDGAATPD